MTDDRIAIADGMLPACTHFHLDAELTKATGLSWQWWRRKIDSGDVRVFQQRARRSGSRIVIPRSEVVRVLAEMVRQVLTLDLMRRLAERHARSELEVHGNVSPQALLFHGNTKDTIYPNDGEAWSAFVAHMLAERTEYKAHAVVLYRQVDAYVSVEILPTSGVPITLHISTGGA